MAPARGGLVVMANAKKSIACTKEGTNRCAMGPDHSVALQFGTAASYSTPMNWY